ncbi:hypothetical protein ACOBQB_00235 [Streptomyces sp. G5(2025)]|uniref:hypothetical protein n=1 Tax=Streptomyces sp. G5(2025) TaxID=3406628 RepID=UPI003C21A7A0
MKRAERTMDYAAVRYRNRITAAGVTLTALAALTACSSSDGGDTSDDASKPSPKTSSSTEPSALSTPTAASDPEDVVEEAAKAAYIHMWDEQSKAYAKADPKGTKLRTYAAALAWAQIKNDLKGLKAKGIVTTGAPSHDVEVTDVKPDKQVPWAALTDCIDTTDWKFVYRKSGKAVPMPENRLKSYVMKIQAEKWGKQWKVVDMKPQDRAC